MKKKWWNDKVVYQVYPKSFYDANGDGIGDVRGIIEKLDYIEELGVDLIWVSPIYKSPMKDNGYDISDYYEIDPMFGTMADMDELLLKAKEKGIGLLMDLVVNHCSSEHQWFQEALKDPTGEYGEYFIFKKSVDGAPPNNWRSIFGGSVWEPVESTDLFYYHTFAKEQPDLNWENPKLRQKIYEMMNWWLAKGLSGFRVDAITYIKKDQTYQSIAADGADGLAELGEVSSNYPGIEVFLKEMREETFDKYDAFSVAEMSGVDVQSLKNYIGPDGLFGSIFDFSYMEVDVEDFQWYRPKQVTAAMIKERMFKSQLAAQEAESYLSVVLENHDQPRSLSKWFREDEIGYESATMLAVMNLMLRGVPFIYQGEEIGMKNIHFDDIHSYDDIMLWGQYERAKREGINEQDCLHMANRRSRDHARTPMQWTKQKNAGFTTGQPFFSVNSDYITVNAQGQDQGKSILNFYRKVIGLRKSEKWRDIFVQGDFVPVYERAEHIIAYRRKLEEKEVTIVLNYVNSQQTIDLECEPKQILISNYDIEKVEQSVYVLQPFEALVFT